MTEYLRLRHAMTGALRDDMVLRADGAHIPDDPLNRDWQAYQAWLKAGNTPDEPDGTTPNRAAVAAHRRPIPDPADR